MFQKYKKQLLFASAITLLPTVLGLFSRNYLQQQILARWGFDGSVPLMAFLLFQPLFLLAVLWISFFFTARDPGNQNRNGKSLSLVLWIIPVLSSLMYAMVFAVSLGASQALPKAMPIFIGLMFAVIGNFMPKTKRNSTIGVKVSWTLASDENWNATHRFAGRLWFICGVLMMLSSCLPSRMGLPLFIGLVFFLAFAPMVYAYLYYKKQRRAGTIPAVDASGDLRWGKWSLAILAAILIFVGVMMFTGNIEYVWQEESFSIQADYYSDMTLTYDKIDNVEYRETDDPGRRAFGFGSARLLMGAFENDEFGAYTRYSYTGCQSAVVLTSGEKVLVLSGRDDAETRAIYEELLTRTA